MKYFIVTDVHSFYSLMIEALNKAGFDKTNKEHIFVCLGDLLDRGNEPLECLKFVNSLPRKILIRGNHEDLIEDVIRRRDFLINDYSNGTTQTIVDLVPSVAGARINNIDDMFDCVSNNEDLNNYLNSLRDYYEDDASVFVHGWIPFDKDSQSMLPDWHFGDWDVARWSNGMDAWNSGIKLPNKTIYCGHWHTSWGHHHLHHSSVEWDSRYSTTPSHQKADFSPFIDDGIVALDACTAFSHKVNCFTLDVPDSEVFKWQ